MDKTTKVIVNNAITTISKALDDAGWEDIGEVNVTLPITGKKACHAIRDYFTNRGWKVTLIGVREEVGSGDSFDPIHMAKVATTFNVKW